MAMTADGKIASANRRLSVFGSDRDREHMLELRASADAVMSGARTVDSARVTMGPGSARFRRLRLRRGLAEYNLRVVVSGSGSVDPESEVFKHAFSPIVLLTTSSAPEAVLGKLRALGVEVAVFGTGSVDFGRALHWLRKEHGVRRLLCEGGGELNDALFRAGLVDELHLTISPKILGGRAAHTLADGEGVQRLADATRLTLRSMERIGDELFVVYRVVRE